MPEFAQRIIGELQALTLDPTSIKSRNEVVIIAADLISKHTIKNFCSSVFPEVDNEGVTVSEVKSIRSSLLHLAAIVEDPGMLGTIFYALAKLHDKRIVGICEHHLLRAMQMHTATEHYLTAVLRALEDSDEKIVWANPPHLQRMAAKYLNKKKLL